MTKSKLEKGDETKVSHLIFGTVDVMVIKEGEDDKGDYYIGRIIKNQSMFNEPIKFRTDDVME